jgi:hypothetical protein
VQGGKIEPASCRSVMRASKPAKRTSSIPPAPFRSPSKLRKLTLGRRPHPCRFETRSHAGTTLPPIFAVGRVVFVTGQQLLTWVPNVECGTVPNPCKGIQRPRAGTRRLK